MTPPPARLAVPLFVRVLGARCRVALAHTVSALCVAVRGARGDLYFRRFDGRGVGAARGARIHPDDVTRLRVLGGR